MVVTSIQTIKTKELELVIPLGSRSFQLQHSNYMGVMTLMTCIGMQKVTNNLYMYNVHPLHNIVRRLKMLN